MEKNMWCLMLCLSYNMWEDSPTRPSVSGRKFGLTLECDKKVWDEVTELAAKEGCNSILIDVGDGVKYKSHPEIAVEGAWEPEYLREELNRLRGLGLTPYPKVNFSALIILGPHWVDVVSAYRIPGMISAVFLSVTA